MNVLNAYKKNYSIIKVIILLSILSVVNTLEGFLYAEYGFSNVFILAEIFSFALTMIIVLGIWCGWEKDKCTTYTKDK